MRPGRTILSIWLGLASVAISAGAQDRAAQQEITVMVVNALPQPAQPVQAVDVSLWSQDIALQQRPTNSQGEALLDISRANAQAGDLRIEIAHAGNLVLYLPAGGNLESATSLPARLTIRLLPKGSPALLEPAQIHAMLRRMSLEIARLQRQNSAVRTLANPAQERKPDLGAAIDAWAEANGFSSAQVDRQVQQWADEIEKQSGTADAEQKALAEMALQHYEAAAQLFNEARDDDKQELSAEEAQEQALQQQAKALEAAEQKLLNSERVLLGQYLDHSQQAASADQLGLEYEKATQTLESAELAAEAEYRKHPEDRGLHELWLRAVLAAANGRRQEAWTAPADRAAALIAQTVGDFHAAAREYADLHDPQGEAAVQDGLANALVMQATEVSRGEAAAQLQQAVEAYQQALAVDTREVAAKQWATIESDLGMALTNEAAIAGGDRSAALFAEAVQAFRDSLEVRTKAEDPAGWALSELNLGNALTDEAEHAGSADAPGLFQQAVEALRAALTVFTKTSQPYTWGLAQNDLGIALFHQAQHVPPQQSAELLAQAVDALRSALEVFTFTGLPQNWAMAQNNLGNVYWLEGERSEPAEAAAFYQKAVEAYRNTLLVRTKEASPQSWAMSMANVALIIDREGELEPNAAQAVPLFEQAANTNRQALEIFDRQHFPQYWAHMEVNLAEVLEAEAERVQGSQSDALFDEAVTDFQQALEVRTRAELPQDWAETEGGLGAALLEYGERTEGEKSAALLRQSSEAWRNALQVFTQSSFPEDWADMHLGLEQTGFAEGDFSGCISEAALLPDRLLSPTQLLVRDAFRMACHFSARDRAEAAQAERIMLTEAGAPSLAYTNLGGAISVLSRSPAFAPKSPAWIALFTAVQKGNRAETTAALHQLEPILQQ